MDAILIFKWGFDPEDAYVTANGEFKWKRGKLVASDDDAAACASLRAWVQQNDATIVGVSAGNGDASWAAARGAQRSYSAPALMPQVDEAACAADLAELVRAAGSAELVVMADAVDRAGVAAALAAELGLPCVLGVLDFAADPDSPGCVVAHRQMGDMQQTIRFKTPALVGVSATRSEDNIPTMKEMLAARKAPLETLEPEPGSARGLTVKNRCRAELKQAQLFDGSPDEAVNALVAALRHDGVFADCKGQE